MKVRNYRIPIIYVIVGASWITISDSLLEWMQRHFHPGVARYIAPAKGIFYVLATGFLLYILINKERKKLVESDNKRMAEIVDKMNNLIIISDISGRITWVNRAFISITGYTMKEALGRTHGELLYGPKTDTETVGKLNRAMENEEFFSGEMVNYDKNGNEYWSQFNLSPMFNAKGELEGYISVENNINDSKLKENEIIRQHEKLKAVSWLNSHEIRKPVASILALTELLAEEKDDTERQELIAYLQQSTIELDSIIHQINEEAAVR